MKWGDKYSPKYVNRLYGMVARNTTQAFRFVCFTDDVTNIRSEVEIQKIPSLNLPPNTPERGWQKLSVFAKDFGKLTGKTLFLDLDIIIVANIDALFTAPNDFLIIKEKKHGSHEGNSSVFRFEIGKYPHILANFKENFTQIKQEVRHEQAYLSREIRQLGKLNFWTKEWIASFKYDCCPNWDTSWFQKPRIPEGTKIIIFHGLPNPDDAIKGISGKWYRHIQPTNWILDYWKV